MISKSKTAREQVGQSMVEYAIGIGAVAALCMIALGGLGHLCSHMILHVEESINYNGTKSQHPGETININATPWKLD